MRKDSVTKFRKIIKNAAKIAIVTHWSPDGDAMGSSLALYHFLKKLGKNVQVIVPNDYPDFLDFLPGNRQVVNFQHQEKQAARRIKDADLIFTLDFNSYKRLEKLGGLLAVATARKVLIDHHQQPDDYALLYYHDVKACSTCELIFDLITDMGHRKLIDKKIATCLYTGLMTDTGSFRYDSVTARTHQVLAELLKTGIQPSQIHSAVYDSYSLKRLKLLGFALSEKLRTVPGLPVAYFTLSTEELERFNYQKGDTEGLVNYPFSVKGIRVTALLNEAEDYVKISFRSKGHIDMNRFARKYFEGGGHINAAGGKSLQSLEETEKKFLNHVKELFDA